MTAMRNDKPRTVSAAMLPEIARGVLLTFGIGLAASLALAGAVLLLASHGSAGW